MKFVQPRRSIPEDTVTISAFNNDDFSHLVNSKLPSNPAISTNATRIFKGKRESKSKQKASQQNAATSPKSNNTDLPDDLQTPKGASAKVSDLLII